MHSINLLSYADHSEKIPEHFLRPKENAKSNSTWKILFAHFVDFTLAFGTATVMSIFYGHIVRSILVTSSLRNAFEKQTLMPLDAFLLPLVLMSYFFISHFMNHGQTLGMILVKSRITMKTKDYKESLYWAIQSTLLCLSMGISYFFSKKNWQSFTEQDYLYEQLMTTIEDSPIDLISESMSFEEKAQETHEEYARAA